MVVRDCVVDYGVVGGIGEAEFWLRKII